MDETKNIFREKLSNHEIPIDSSFWDDMEKRLDDKKRRKPSVPLWRYIGGIAAAVALLLAVTPLFVPQSEKRQIAKTFKQNFKQPLEENNAEKNIRENITDNYSPVETVKSQAVQARSQAPAAGTGENQPDAQTDIVFSENTADSSEPASETKKTTASETIPEKKQTSDRNIESLVQKQPARPFIRKKTKKPVALALAANFWGRDAGGNLSLSDKNYSSGFHRAPAYDPDNITIEQILKNYPEENHLPPLSVGVSVRKNFNRYFALETGLAYTYLYSTFSNNYTLDAGKHATDHVRLTQHYIGIPLNAIINIVDGKAWNFYFSLGGMAEKGIWLNYRREQIEESPYRIYEQNLDQNDIDGLQWSASAAIGAAYRLYGNMSLYFEPKLNWYFDCDQPRSFRTASPLNISLNAGVRFEL